MLCTDSGWNLHGSWLSSDPMANESNIWQFGDAFCIAALLRAASNSHWCQASLNHRPGTACEDTLHSLRTANRPDWIFDIYTERQPLGVQFSHDLRWYFEMFYWCFTALPKALWQLCLWLMPVSLKYPTLVKYLGKTEKNNRLRWYPQQPQRFIFINLSEASWEAKRWKHLS